MFYLKKLVDLGWEFVDHGAGNLGTGVNMLQ